MLLLLGHIMDGHLVLVGGVEGNLGDLGGTLANGDDITLEK